MEIANGEDNVTVLVKMRKIQHSFWEYFGFSLDINDQVITEEAEHTI